MIFTNWYAILSFAVLLQWLITPVLVNLLTTSESSNVRLQNIVNLNFGVSTHTFNQNYVIFYLIELFITLCAILLHLGRLVYNIILYSYNVSTGSPHPGA